MQLLETYTFIADQLSYPVYLCDKNGNFMLLNPAWEQMTGFSMEESLGKNFLDYIYPEDKEQVIHNYYSHLQKKLDTYREEVRLLTKEGKPIWIDKNSKIHYDLKGNVSSITGTLLEVTDRKQIEERLLKMNDYLSIQSEKLSAVAQLSASIAHEVRNPLTAISGFLQLMKENKKAKDEYIDIIFSELERIELVLSELLVLAKPKSQNSGPFNISKTIHYVVTLLSSEASMRNTEIKMSGFDGMEWINGDENQIKQVFINIIKNAIEAMPQGGTVEVIKSKTETHLAISVVDTGPGIPEDIINKIGQPFFTTKETGTGLGLSICYKILESHNGKLEIDSSEEGTTFTVILPLYQDQKDTA